MLTDDRGASATVSDRSARFPVVLLAIMLIYVAPMPALAMPFAIIALASLLVPKQVELSGISQAFVALSLLGAGLLLPRPFGETWTRSPDVLTINSFPFACGALAIAAGRLHILRPVGGTPLTMAAALVGMVAVGRANTGAVYPVSVVLFLILAFGAMQRGDSGRPPLRKLSRRHRIGAAVAVALAGAFGFGAAIAVPQGYQWAMGRISDRLSHSTGFSDVMWLGSLEGLLQSQTVVMRVRGERVDHLRGVVFTNYIGGRWAQQFDEQVWSVEMPTELAVGEQSSEIEFVGKPDRYFAPLSANRIAVSSGYADTDRLGTLRPRRADQAKRVWLGPAGERMPPVGGPEDSDRVLPTRIHASLQRLAREWTRDVAAGDVEAMLGAIELRLREEYTYSLRFEQYDNASDPVLDFLVNRKEGHCEYFASAMALLGRSLGIPTRVAGGYRVFEYSPLGEYYIVRERDAHAWVEAWVEGKGWVTYDPTPMSSVVDETRVETPMSSAVFDLIATQWEAVDDWLTERSAEEMTVALLLLLATLPFIRWWRQRQARKKNKADPFVDRPLPWFEDFCRWLARKGARRRADESVEAFARRMTEEEGIDPSLRQDVASMLEAYAALRYGGVGDAAGLERRMRGLMSAKR